MALLWRKEEHTLPVPSLIFSPSPYIPSKHKMFNKWLILVDLHKLDLKAQFCQHGNFYQLLYLPLSHFSSATKQVTFWRHPDTREHTGHTTLTSSTPKTGNIKEHIFLLKIRVIFPTKDPGICFFFFFKLQEFFLLTLCKTAYPGVHKSLSNGYAH